MANNETNSETARDKSITVISGDRVHWSDGTILGACESGGCRAPAPHYNEDGQLRCTECLAEEESDRCEDCENLPMACECYPD